MFIRLSYMFILCLSVISLKAQISPGKLTSAHAGLEGISHCTECHELRDKVSNTKCPDCHTEIKKLIETNSGFHANETVRGKDCAKCHNEHHGREFDIIRFDPDTFNHALSGYKLKGRHAQIDCRECHNPKNIVPDRVEKKEDTWLGLNNECLSCHEDYHQETLSNECIKCHGFDAFRPAENFNHADADFPLTGEHLNVDCQACHQVTTRNDREFQIFTGIEHANCNSCHEDVHENRFGQDCKKCHTENSFHEIEQITSFDHSQTGYMLRGKHQSVDCESCHGASYTKPLKHQFCTDCHDDYHNGQIVTENRVTDCGECHTVNGFSPSTFTIEDHDQSEFQLTGAHLATPCFACHQQQNSWQFSSLNTTCISCHEDIHQLYISEEYYPDQDCRICHTTGNWIAGKFNHETTGYELFGKHEEVTCRACHYTEDKSGNEIQQFASLNENCLNCHEDNHRGQFEYMEGNYCTKCHHLESWGADKFDHDNTKFSLEGEHKKAQCGECHKEVSDEKGIYIQYQIKQFKCIDCHL
jgi:hypothetical protein